MLGRRVGHDGDASQRIFRDQRSESTMRCDNGGNALGGQTCGGRERGTGRNAAPFNPSLPALRSACFLAFFVRIATLHVGFPGSGCKLAQWNSWPCNIESQIPWNSRSPNTANTASYVRYVMYMLSSTYLHVTLIYA